MPRDDAENEGNQTRAYVEVSIQIVRMYIRRYYEPRVELSSDWMTILTEYATRWRFWSSSPFLQIFMDIIANERTEESLPALFRSLIRNGASRSNLSMGNFSSTKRDTKLQENKHLSERVRCTYTPSCSSQPAMITGYGRTTREQNAFFLSFLQTPC